MIEILNIFSPKFINLCPYFLHLFLFTQPLLVPLLMDFYLILLINFFAIFLVILFLVYVDLITISHKMVHFLSFYFIDLYRFVISFYFQLVLIQMSFHFFSLTCLLITLIRLLICLLVINLVNQAVPHLFEILNFILNFLEPLIFSIIQLLDSTKVNIIVKLIGLVEV